MGLRLHQGPWHIRRNKAIQNKSELHPVKTNAVVGASCRSREKSSRSLSGDFWAQPCKEKQRNRAMCQVSCFLLRPISKTRFYQSNTGCTRQKGAKRLDKYHRTTGPNPLAHLRPDPSLRKGLAIIRLHVHQALPLHGFARTCDLHGVLGLASK